MTLTTLLLTILAVWRVTHLLHAEDGPWQVFERLRTSAGDGVAGSVLGCFYCLSIWVAAPAAAVVATTWTDGVLLWLAASGGAILAERVTTREAAAWYAEDEPLTPQPNDALWDAAEKENGHDAMAPRSTPRPTPQPQTRPPHPHLTDA